MAEVTKIKYYTEEKYRLISEENISIYERYLRSKAIKNKDTMETSYSLYQRNFMYFLVFLAEHYDNIGLYSEDFLNNAVDVIEDYMYFCMSVLNNNKKTINNKVNAIASFYKWSNKRKLIDSNPLADRLERISRADEEKIINDYFLTEEQIEKISAHLLDVYDERFDFQDMLLWFIFLDSANRIGAIEKLSISQIDYERKCFTNVLEKEVRVVDVSVSERTIEMINEWIQMRKLEYDLLSEDALFITKYNGRWNRMTRRTIQKRIAKIGTIIDIQDLHPHSIRKSVASNMLDNNVDSYLISRYLNHKSLDVLKHYIKPKSSFEIREQIDKQLNKN